MINSWKMTKFSHLFSKIAIAALVLIYSDEIKAQNKPNSYTRESCDCAEAKDYTNCLRCCAGGCIDTGGLGLPLISPPGLFQKPNETYLQKFRLEQNKDRLNAK